MSDLVLEKTATVANLLAAYEGESNAHIKYVVFAAKADAEGWHGAASLFRAAARAEEIHATNHSRVLKQLGVEAKHQNYPAQVKSTLENLKAALAGEQYEIDTMYPGFIAEATESDIPIAKRSFTWAMEAEKTHARLYAESIELVEKEEMKDSWAASACDFYICAACGYTTRTPEEQERCPVCNLAFEKFEVIR
jgi:rubrerythrin